MANEEKNFILASFTVASVSVAWAAVVNSWAHVQHGRAGTLQLNAKLFGIRCFKYTKYST